MRLPSEESAVDLADLQRRLGSADGPTFWRSLEEAADTESFRSYVQREFPDQASELADPETRRTFLKVMGASLALAGVSGCAIRTPEKIIPWVKSPENIVPGKPQFFASAMTMNGLATGILVESHQGRPTRVEGNPLHPASLGSSDIFMQAASLQLYDPDRSQVVLHEGEVSTWDDFVAAVTAEMIRLRGKNGAGLRLLTETVNSPSLGGQIRDLLAALPEAKWHRYEPASHEAAKAGAKLAFGEYVDAIYHFDKADVVLSLDHDFLACGSPGRVSDERRFAARRDPKPGTMNRLYVAESAYTNTGAAADHRLAIQQRQVADLALAIAKELGVEGANPGSLDVRPLEPANATADDKKAAREAADKKTARIKTWVAAVAKDLKANAGKSLVLVGDGQPAYVHALGHAINAKLNNHGENGTVTFIEPIEVDPVDQVASLTELVNDVDAGKVEMLVILGGNPAYTAPVDLGAKPDPKQGADEYRTAFARTLGKIGKAGGITVRLGEHDDETSNVCTWHVPQANFLEAWSDARAFDGTASIVQPMIKPLYNGRSPHELIATLMGEFDRQPLTLVRDHWRATKPEGDFELFWRRALHDGVVANSAAKPKAVTAKPVADFGARPAVEAADYEIVIRPDPTIWDGRYANNGWLQELPKPLTKLVWDNAALVSINTARVLGLNNDQVAELTFRGRMIKAPVFIVPGQADGTVVIHQGYGRWRGGQLALDHGFNANELRTTDAPWGAGGLKVGATREKYRLVSTQMQRNVEGRDHVRSASLEQFKENPGIFHEGSHHEAGSLSPLWEYDSYKWGMAIDINSCTGCNACVIGCMAENNSPVIGKEQMGVGRNMQWIEVDTYFNAPHEDNPDLVDTYFQPRLCMHCENAPCELVCPVAATVHDAEGLNVMVYNRCVGTRYCGNNCPYKVRHFNYLDYSDQVTPSLKLLNNPDVTVRSRGVMEKCTYCVQRISGARINAKEQNRPIRDGEVQTACQVACPAQAIHFGNLNDKESKVYKIKQSERDYAMLGELNVRPRTTYLARVRNYNPELQTAEA